MKDKSARASGSEAVAARQDPTRESAWRFRTAALRRRLRSMARPVRGLAALRIWVRGSEIAIVALAILAGGTSGLVASLMGGATHWLHVTLFGPGAQYGLSAIKNRRPVCRLPHADPRRPAARVAEPRPGAVVAAAPIDPIEANALYGGRMSLADGAWSAHRTSSRTASAPRSVWRRPMRKREAASHRGSARAFGLRRADLRVLVGCGAAGAIAAAFGAPLTGAFYAFELIIGSYTIANLAPVMASAVAGSLVASALGGVDPLALLRGIGTPVWSDYGLALVLGILCGLVGHRPDAEHVAGGGGASARRALGRACARQ